MRSSNINTLPRSAGEPVLNYLYLRATTLHGNPIVQYRAIRGDIVGVSKYGV